MNCSKKGESIQVIFLLYSIPCPPVHKCLKIGIMDMGIVGGGKGGNGIMEWWNNGWRKTREWNNGVVE